MADRKERFALLSKFESLCKANNLPKPSINKYNEQWAADALLESFDYNDLLKAMNHYFSVSPRPTWKGYANNVDKILQYLQQKKEDDELRAEMRRKAKEWLSESRG